MEFANFAGQLTAQGVGTFTPMATLEANYKTNIQTINGLLPKIGTVFLDETRVFGDPMASVFTKTDQPFGGGVEFGAFIEGTANKKRDGTCFPKGSAALVSQVAWSNYAYNNDVTLYDYEINKAVFTPEEAASYFANKLRLPLKTTALLHYQACLQLLSDVIDGTRSISSYDRSDGSATVGAAVTYAADVIGYCGKVTKSDLAISVPAEGELTTISADDSMDFVKIFEGIAADMEYESKSFNKAGVSTFITGKPYLICEKKTLNALDHAFMTDGNFKGFPTKTAREFLGRFADIVEINKFPSLPTNASYADYHIGGIMIDKDACKEYVLNATVESMRCVNERATGYNFQGESILTVKKTVPSYALLVTEPQASSN